MTYHNECLLDYTACSNGVTIKVGKKGPCPLGDKNESDKGTQSDDFVTDGDDDENNTSENKEILRDPEGNKKSFLEYYMITLR